MAVIRIQLLSNLLALTYCLAADQYLFTSFRGNGETGVFLALSTDGRTFTPLNNNKPWIKPELPGMLVRIHPFLDGNGGVARMVSHAMMLEVLGTAGVWSVARGLARNVARYKGLLASCDLTRRNDLDGRGNLSEEATAEFIRFFLQVSIDQVEFMESVMQPERLRTRIRIWAEEESQM